MVYASHDGRRGLHEFDEAVRLLVAIPCRELEFESIHVGHGVGLDVLWCCSASWLPPLARCACRQGAHLDRRRTIRFDRPVDLLSDWMERWT